MKSLRTTVLEASVEFVEQPFLAPLVISSGAITTLSEAIATVRVRVENREATGRGSIYLSDLWAWPDPSLAHARRDAALRSLCRELAARLPDWCGGEPAHPLELGLRLHHNVCETAAPPPALARAMCASPFDAAIHDAVGQALNLSAFAFYQDDVPLPSADPFFDGITACQAIRTSLLEPRPRLAAWYLVVKSSDRDQLRPWVQERRYRCFKIKLLGRNAAEDVGRTVEVFRTLRELGASDLRLSVDTNEANPDADSVVAYLQKLREADGEAYAALQYLEQPTGRDITTHRFDWRRAARLKPVLLDEGLTRLDLMPLAREQGWSGFALKTCKGHSFALAAAAWAQRHAMSLSLQDLTNPGLSLIHAALLAAHLPTINGIELNSPQFTPAANAHWLPRLKDLFEPTDGYHRIPHPIPAGLGSRL